MVVVPFPFTERPTTKRRPAVVLSHTAFNEAGYTLLAMVTTQAHAPWPGDTPIQDRDAAGLHVLCIVRLKAFTIDNRLIAKKIGHLSPSDRARVVDHLRRYVV